MRVLSVRIYCLDNVAAERALEVFHSLAAALTSGVEPTGVPTGTYPWACGTPQFTRRTIRTTHKDPGTGEAETVALQVLECDVDADAAASGSSALSALSMDEELLLTRAVLELSSELSGRVYCRIYDNTDGEVVLADVMPSVDDNAAENGVQLLASLPEWCLEDATTAGRVVLIDGGVSLLPPEAFPPASHGLTESQLAHIMTKQLLPPIGSAEAREVYRQQDLTANLRQLTDRAIHEHLAACKVTLTLPATMAAVVAADPAVLSAACVYAAEVEEKEVREVLKARRDQTACANRLFPFRVNPRMAVPTQISLSRHAVAHLLCFVADPAAAAQSGRPANASRRGTGDTQFSKSREIWSRRAVSALEVSCYYSATIRERITTTLRQLPPDTEQRLLGTGVVTIPLNATSGTRSVVVGSAALECRDDDLGWLESLISGGAADLNGEEPWRPIARRVLRELQQEAQRGTFVVGGEAGNDDLSDDSDNDDVGYGQGKRRNEEPEATKRSYCCPHDNGGDSDEDYNRAEVLAEIQAMDAELHTVFGERFQDGDSKGTNGCSDRSDGGPVADLQEQLSAMLQLCASEVEGSNSPATSGGANKE